MNNQAKVILTSFIYFSIVMEKNDKLDDMPDGLKKLFRKLAWTSEKYKHHMKEVTNQVNEILSKSDLEVDFMLMSVSLISEYYEQMRGNKRLFTPMNYKEILKIQDECIDTADSKVVDDTFDVCEILVKGLLTQ